MLDIGWSEILFLAIIVLLVLGPQEIPGLLKQAGRFSARAKQMANQFRQGLETIEADTAIKELREAQKNLSPDYIKQKIKDEIDGAVNAPDLFAASSADADSGAEADTKKPAEKNPTKKPAPKKTVKKADNGA